MSDERRPAKIENPVHPQSHGLAECILKQPKRLRNQRESFGIERRSDERQRVDSFRRFYREIRSDFAAQ